MSERGRGRWVDLGCLMTPGFSKDILSHVLPYCSKQYGTERDKGNIMREGEGKVGRLGLFNDTWSQ